MFTYIKTVYIDSLKDIIISFSISIKQFDKTLHMLFFKGLNNDSHPNPVQFQSITFLVRMILGQCPLGACLPSTRLPERTVVASLDHYGSNQVRLGPIPRRATCFLTRGAAHYLVRARQSSIIRI